MAIRLLFINFGEEDVPVISDNLDVIYERRTWRGNWKNLPALHDYHVIITDLHNMSEKDIKYACKKAKKIKEQVETGGYLIIFSGPDKKYQESVGISMKREYTRYKWIPESLLLNAVEEFGKSVVVRESLFRQIFDAFGDEDISWDTTKSTQ